MCDVCVCVCANVVCQQWRLAVRRVSALWGLKPYGLGGSGHGDGVVFWFGFGQGVNKSGEEAMVLTSLQTILVVQETCLPSQTRATHTLSHTLRCTILPYGVMLLYVLDDNSLTCSDLVLCRVKLKTRMCAYFQ